MDYDMLAKQMRALLEGETDTVACLAKNGELLLGPFQGKPACAHIPFDKGVCGAAFSGNKTLRIEDVHAFPGHIACDGASNSELVIPLRNAAGGSRCRARYRRPGFRPILGGGPARA